MHALFPFQSNQILDLLAVVENLKEGENLQKENTKLSDQLTEEKENLDKTRQKCDLKDSLIRGLCETLVHSSVVPVGGLLASLAEGVENSTPGAEHIDFTLASVCQHLASAANRKISHKKLVSDEEVRDFLWV